MKNVNLLLFFTVLLLVSGSVRAQSDGSDLESFALKRQEAGAKFEKKRTINIYGILFATGKASLSPQIRDYIQTKVTPYILKFPPSSLITVEGHTDSQGSAKLNEELSKQRADSVRAFLIEQGISANRLVSAGYGESFPLHKNDSEEGRRKNRRVTLTLEHTGTGAKIHTTDGQVIDARFVQYEDDGTISYTTSDSSPTVKLKSSEIKHVAYSDGSTYDPNSKITGTIRLKNGREIRARMIAQEPGSVSYKVSDTSPLVTVKSSEVEAIRYADGREVKPDGEKPEVKEAKSEASGVIVLKTGNELEAYNIGKAGSLITYAGEEGGAINKIQKHKVSYIRYANGQIENISASNSVSNVFNLNWLNKFINLTRVSVLADFGAFPLNVKKGQIDFRYVDESPSKDNMQSLIGLKSQFLAYGGQFGLEWETDQSLLWRVYYQFAKNSEGSNSGLGLGIGKLLGSSKQWRAGADLQFGSASVKLGKLYQNDLFIQVNSKRFYSDEVRVGYRNYFVALNPYISYEKSLGSGLSLRGTLGAAVGLHTRSAITFRGEDVNGRRVKASEKTSADNVTFRLDGEKTTNAKLFSILGPQAKIGVYYTVFSRSK